MNQQTDTDVVIVLDCGNYERVCANLENYNGNIIKFRSSSYQMICMVMINYVDTNAAATAEIVYELLNGARNCF